VATPNDGAPGSGRPKTPVDQWFEWFVYAPLGFALDARQLLPRFIDRGRSQVALARVVGRYAVQRGSVRAEDYLGEEPAAQLASLLQTLGLLPPDPPRDEPAGSAPTLTVVTNTDLDGGQAEAPIAEPEPEEPDEEAGEVVAADALAIPDYDTLSASQVVPRLGGLDSDELEAVRRYEAAGRGRKTILNKIAQLAAS
jgi:hypothetical protein